MSDAFIAHIALGYVVLLVAFDAVVICLDAAGTIALMLMIAITIRSTIIIT